MENNVSVVSDVVALSSSQELLIQLLMIVALVTLSAIGYYGDKVLRTNATVKKYVHDTDKLESILEKAVIFAEGAITAVIKDKVSKTDVAFKYIKDIDPTLIKKHGENIQAMVKRKAYEMGKEGWIDTDGDGVPDTPPEKVVDKK